MTKFDPHQVHYDISFYVLSARVFGKALERYRAYLQQYAKPGGEKLKKQISGVSNLQATLRRGIGGNPNDHDFIEVNIRAGDLQLIKSCLVYLIATTTDELDKLTEEQAPQAAIEDKEAELNRMKELMVVGIMSDIPVIEGLMGPLNPDHSKKSSNPELIMFDDELIETVREIKTSTKTNDRAIDDAVTVLEDRLRKLSGLSRDSYSKRLVDKALRKDGGILILSSEANEQESWHTLYLGVITALKNPTSHARFSNIPDERAIQVVQFVDYLVGQLQEAKKR